MTYGARSSSNAGGRGDVVVYVGPTLNPATAQEILPFARVRPPVARDDMYRDREQGAAAFVVIDGVFTQHLAVSAREVVDVARDGAIVIGSSSMGALRAAECWPAGVRGVGVVYRAYRMGVLDDDGEVAVAADQDAGYRALTVPLVNVRYGVAHAVRKRLLDRATGLRVVAIAKDTFYTERRWDTLLKAAKVTDADGSLARALASRDIKREDAVRALRLAARSFSPERERLAAHARPSGSAPFVRRHREAVSDLFGRTRADLQAELTAWLFGTGRHEKYCWPIVACHPEFKSASAGPTSDRAREGFARVLAEVLPGDGSFADDLWDELASSGELRAEVARLHAAKDLAARGATPHPKELARARSEVAIAYGAVSWGMLVANVTDGKLCGAIPFAWVEQATEMIARARSFTRT